MIFSRRYSIHQLIHVVTCVALASCGGSDSSTSSNSALSNEAYTDVAYAGCVTDKIIVPDSSSHHVQIETANLMVSGDAQNPPLYSKQVNVSNITGKGAINFNGASAAKVEVLDDPGRTLLLEVLEQIQSADPTRLPFFSSGNIFVNQTTSGIEQFGYSYDWSKRFEGTLHTTVIYTPAFKIPFDLVANVPFSQSYTVKRVTSRADGTMRDQVEGIESRTITFLGIESVTVLAGTFSACKIRIQRKLLAPPFDESDVTEWTVASGANRGLFVKSVDNNGTIRQTTSFNP